MPKRKWEKKGQIQGEGKHGTQAEHGTQYVGSRQTFPSQTGAASENPPKSGLPGVHMLLSHFMVKIHKEYKKERL